MAPAISSFFATAAVALAAAVVALVLTRFRVSDQSHRDSWQQQLPASPLILNSSLGLSSADDLVVDIAGLVKQINDLATFSDDEAPAVTRILFSPNDVAARSFVKERMEAAGLVVREDAIGNIFGRWEGSRPSAAAVLSGSHTDAILLAGRFDGVLGVLGAIEAIAALKRTAFVPPRPLEVVMFTSEEPTRFGFGCLGSRLLANQEGYLDKLLLVKDKNDVSFAEAAREAGYLDASNVDRLREVPLSRERVAAFVELHIEQGPTLENEGIQIGAVTAIAAPAAIDIELSGGGGHAGALLMPFRNDAGLAAAEISLAVERHVLGTKSIDTVGTTGHVSQLPNAINSVPRYAKLQIDVRDIDGERRDRVVAAIKKSTEQIARRRNVTIERFEIVNADPPASSSPSVLSAVLSAAAELGFSLQPMVSRAYHDSLFMARVAPTGMIFIPCFKGYSHRPDEFATADDIKRGVEVLALTLAKLSLMEEI